MSAALHSNPISQFSLWYQDWEKECVAHQIPDSNSMSLGTVNGNGLPAVRTVLLKGFDDRGFVFFTNYESRKAKEIESAPLVSILFYWSTLARQVRVEGIAKKVSALESDEYFRTRARGSQIGAWASLQSKALDSRLTLEERVRFFEEKFKNQEVSRPLHWGGYFISPERFEFWQGRTSRLHERTIYEKNQGVWQTHFLFP